MQIKIITGPTATGKTRLAVELAKGLGLNEQGEPKAELINADSRQIYKYLDIITGKDKDKLSNIPIHLYDILDPKKPFSSYNWAKLALQYINILKNKGKTPIIVGGTYLYIRHLLYGIETEGIGPDWNLRRDLKDKSVEELQKMLKSFDPLIFKSLNESDRNNPRRLIRKIEIANQVKSQKSKVKNYNLKFKINNNLKGFGIEFIGLKFKDQIDLRGAIQKRVEKRLKQGAVEEVKKLLDRSYKVTDPGLQATACCEIVQFIDKKISRDQLIERWTTQEMQYAKRQMTFMSPDPNINWREI